MPKSRTLAGAYRASVDLPEEFSSDLTLALTAKPKTPGGVSYILFDLVDGSDPQDTRLPGVYLRLSRMNDAVKGSGAGVWLYRQIIDWAHRKGLRFYSDYSVSEEAQHA